MDRYETLQDIIKKSRYRVDRNKPEEPLVIIRGVVHFDYSSTEEQILSRLRPHLILSEDLVDARYSAADNTLNPGIFYQTMASPIQRNLIDGAPLLSAARRLKIDARGISPPQDCSIQEEEIHLFGRIATYASKEKLIYATVGYAHILPSSELIQKLGSSEIPCAIVSFSSSKDPFADERKSK